MIPHISQGYFHWKKKKKKNGQLKKSSANSQCFFSKISKIGPLVSRINGLLWLNLYSRETMGRKP